MSGLIRLRGAILLGVLLLVSAAQTEAHPLSTFGVRLIISGSQLTVILNADEAPLLTKLDALSPTGGSDGPALDRLRRHADLVRSLSWVRADQSRIDLTVAQARTNADGQVELVLNGSLPAQARSVSWQSRIIYGAYPLSVSHGLGGVESIVWLQGVQESPAMPVQDSFQSAATFSGYAALGFVHIIPRGLDHILFVLGLFLLTPRIRPLLAQVTLFTLAHSASLALAMFGVITISPSIVEPLIALSIAYVGIENLFRRTLSQRRLWMVAAFGLLHGLGFAGVLTEISLPPAQWLPALSGFNVGVELGQLAVLGLAAAAMFAWTRWVANTDRWIRQPVSAGIAAMGVFWVVTRAL